MKLRMQPRFMCSMIGLQMAVACFWVSAARAESDANSRALAVQLFDQAEALVAQQRIAEACPKYAESFRLDSQLGALIYLAECYERNGQLASAWGSFREAEEMAQKRGDERAAHAHERASALGPRLDSLLLLVPKAARVPGLTVWRDGVLIAETLWNSAAAIDAGKHHVEARATGYISWRTDLVVSGEAEAAKITIPQLEVDRSTTRTRGDERSPTSPGTSQHIAAIAVGGVGIVALGVAGFFGLSAQSTYSDTKDLCNDSDVCTPHGSDLRSSAQSKALISTVATGVGVGGITTAAILWFTAPRVQRAERMGDADARRKRRWVFAPNHNAWGLEMAGAF
jgi:hypothetical protein